MNLNKIYLSLKTKFYNSKFYWTKLRRSSIEFAWWGLRSPSAAGEWKKARKHEVSFYKTLFSQFEVTSVFDIGANVGDKTEIFLSAGCTRVQSVDPDPRCFELLNWRFGHLSCVSIANVGVGSSVSVMTFFRFGNAHPLNTFKSAWANDLVAGKTRFGSKIPEPEEVAISIQTLANLTASSFIPDYIKVDVEGNELEAIRGLEVLPKVLSLEFNLPEFRDEFLSTVSLLVQIDQTVRFKILTETDDGFLQDDNGEMDASAVIEMVDTNQLKYFELFCFSNRSV